MLGETSVKNTVYRNLETLSEYLSRQAEPMHIFLRCPHHERLVQLLKKYSASPITQANVGSSRQWDRSIPEKIPAPKLIKHDGDRILHQRYRIGSGEQDYLAAVKALSLGKCFELNWVEPVLQRPLELNDTFCLIVRAFGLCSVNFCRVVYSGEETTAENKFFSIGVGTLKKHAAIGEERLALNWNQENDEVHFLIDSYSRPSTWLSKIFAFYLRRQQLKFVDQASKRMELEVKNQLK